MIGTATSCISDKTFNWIILCFSQLSIFDYMQNLASFSWMCLFSAWAIHSWITCVVCNQRFFFSLHAPFQMWHWITHKSKRKRKKRGTAFTTIHVWCNHHGLVYINWPWSNTDDSESLAVVCYCELVSSIDHEVVGFLLVSWPKDHAGIWFITVPVSPICDGYCNLSWAC